LITFSRKTHAKYQKKAEEGRLVGSAEGGIHFLAKEKKPVKKKEDGILRWRMNRNTQLPALLMGGTKTAYHTRGGKETPRG